MRYSRRSFVVLFVIMLISDILTAGGFHDRGTVWLSVNPVKIVCGLLNLEFEYVIHEKISMKVSSELLYGDYVYSRQKHPEFVLRTGPGFHYLSNKSFEDTQDLYTGINIGYISSRTHIRLNTLFISADVGYKIMLQHPVYWNSKIHLTRPLSQATLQPGFESLLGITVN